MRRFAFRLEKVLELRAYREREWELKLADVTGRLLGVEREIEQWAGRRVAAAQRTVEAGPVDMDDMRNRAAYVALVDGRVGALHSRLASLEVERERIRERYLEASRRRKALSRLKERRSDEYYEDSLRDEYRMLDEIAGTSTARRLSGSEADNV